MRYTPYVIAACLLATGLCIVPGDAAASSIGWQPEVPLQLEYIYEQAESIGMDDYGNAMVTWEEPFNSSSPGIYAIRYDALSGWEEAVPIWSYDFWCGYTTMAMGPSGEAVALIRAPIDSETSGIFAVMYYPDDGWNETFLVHETDYAGDMAAAVDADGNAIAIWAELSEIWGAIYSPGEGWGDPELLDSSGSWPDVKFDRNGNALAIWNDFDSYTVKSKAYEPSTGWGATVNASDPTGGYWVEMDVNDTGYALASWFLHNGTAWEMYSNIYTPGVGWGVPDTIGPVDDGWHPFGNSVSAGADGEFFLVWEQSDSYSYPQNRSAYAMRWLEGIGWEEPTIINSGLATNSQLFSKVDANRDGQAIATWTDGNETATNVMASVYTPGEGWGPATDVGNESGVSTWYSQVAIASNGDAVLIYKQYVDGTSYLWGREYYALERPDLVVTSPTDDALTDDAIIEVTGITEPGATVTIDGEEVYVDTDGAFAGFVVLVSGPNEISIVATFEGQGSREVVVSVTYEDPVAELLAQIDELLAEIEALGQDIADLQTELGLYVAYSTALEDALAELAVLYADTILQLVEANDLLNESQDDIYDLEDRISEMDDCMADLEDNVTDLESTIAEQEDDASAARTLQYALMAVIGVLALAVVLLLMQNSRLRKGRGPQGPA